MKQKPHIILSKDIHRNQDVVALKFDYDPELIEKVKSIEGSRWSQSKKYWYFKKSDFRLKRIFEALKPVSYLDYSALDTDSKVNRKKPHSEKTHKPKVNIPQRYIDILDQKRYSENTKVIYTSYFGDYMRHFGERSLEDISKEEINAYLLELIRSKNISASQQNQRINAIKFYYEKVLGREKIYVDIERPKSRKALPNVLSTSEIRQMIDKTSNIKHKCIISALYSAGLRRSELINLKATDILSDQMQIKIRNSKGNRDRYVGLSKHLLQLLKEYYREYRPKDWLIEGQKGGKYSAESILKVVKAAAKRAGVSRNVNAHMLRHSFATHHLESGTDLRYIQEFLGHSSSKTTEVYTHVAKTDFSKFNNPLDEIYDDER